MVLIGLLLIAAAVAAAIILVVQNDGTITVHVFDADYHISAYWLAIAGLAIMAVAALGLWMLRAGAAHRMRLRRERRELLRENRRLSERAAAMPDPVDDSTRTTTGSVDRSHGAVADRTTDSGYARGDGAHAEPVRSRTDEPIGSRTDEPGRRPSADA